MKNIYLILVLFLWACSGGGSDSPTEPQTPISFNYEFEVNEDETLNFSFEDIIDSSTITVADNVNSGTLIINNKSATYTPNLNFNGSDSFTYFTTLNNQNSANANVLISVLPVNDAPVVENIEIEFAYNNESIDIDLIGSDVDNDNLTYSIVSEPSLGSVEINNFLASYSPTNEGTDSFTYTASDGQLTSNEATVNIVEIGPRLNTFGTDFSSIYLAETGSGFNVIGVKDYIKSSEVVSIEIDYNGEIISQTLLNTNSGRPISSIISGHDSGFLFVGENIVEKYDSNLNYLWSHEFQNDGYNGYGSQLFDNKYIIRREIFDDNGFHSSLTLDGSANNDFKNLTGVSNGDYFITKSYDPQSNGEILLVSSINNFNFNVNTNSSSASELWRKVIIDANVNYSDIHHDVKIVKSKSSDDFIFFSKFFDKNLYKILKFDSEGNTINELDLSTNSEETMGSITPVSDGYIIVGDVRFNNSCNSASSSSCSLGIIKLDENLNLVWEKEISPKLLYSYSYQVIESSSGNILISGTRIDSNWSRDMYLIMLDNNGNQIF